MRRSPSPTRKRPPASGGRDAGTRSRLLDAAADAFADRGYEDATVREVCRRARANVAAVHYHFGSKERLYVETIKWAMTRCHAAETADLLAFAAKPGLSREERLAGVVAHLARGILGPHPARHLRLVMREMTEPTFALDAMVREFLAPRFQALRGALSAFLPGAGERALSLHAMSVVGQLLYHRVAGPVALRLLKERAYDERLTEEVVAHVVSFTLRAVAGVRAGEASP